MGDLLTREAGGIESRSIDYVPVNERHGKVIDHGKFWFLSNFQFYSIAVGFIGGLQGPKIVESGDRLFDNLFEGVLCLFLLG